MSNMPKGNRSFLANRSREELMQAFEAAQDGSLDGIILGENMTIEPRTVTLSADDPFDAVLIDIVETNRRKRRDYAHDGNDPFTNFRVTSGLLGLEGFGAAESALFNILQKVARLQSLRKNGRMDSPSNESVTDTALDLAVYANIFYALIKERAEW